jgi:hypothetical protein
LPSKIQDLERITEIIDLMNIGQVLNLEYPIADFSIIELVVNVIDGKSMDENRTCLLHPLAPFAFSLKWYPMKKNTKTTSMNQCCISTVTSF